MRSIHAFAIAAVLLGGGLPGRAAAQETKMQAEVRRQRERFAEKCRFDPKAAVGCATLLVTDHPFHLAIGSLAPGNGFGFGLAFVAPQSKPDDTWRINWSADAVGAFGGAWRAGAYARFVRADVVAPQPTTPGGGTPAGSALPRPYPTLTLHAQRTSLPEVAYFGLGDGTQQSDRTLFSMRQTSVGGRVFWPVGRTGVWNRLSPTLLGDAIVRWIDIGTSTGGSAPSIETRFTDVTAPGLDRQPTTTELSGGVRIAPAFARLQLTYTARWQQFVASQAGFHRGTLDLRHDVPLWSTTRTPAVREANTPNECAVAASRTTGDYGCPDPVAITTNRVGSVGLRLFVSRSAASGGDRIPFYFQPTIGGSDIDGQRLLASYDDYRFRGPNVFVLQETFEHVIWGPIGVFAAAEQGRVTLQDQALGDVTLRKTFGGGLTLRAGGVPMVTIWVARGGPEGSHVAMTMSTSLLGGGSRPTLN